MDMHCKKVKLESLKGIAMIATTISPTDFASFNSAMTAVLSEHTTLRRLAAAASKGNDFSSDDVMSLADAMVEHEGAESRLFALPFLTRTPKTVRSTAARARRRCVEYTSGDYHLPDSSAAAALFVDALLAHLAAEEAWLAHEKEQKHERLMTAI
jgi:hypothetical protein